MNYSSQGNQSETEQTNIMAPHTSVSNLKNIFEQKIQTNLEYKKRASIRNPNLNQRSAALLKVQEPANLNDSQEVPKKPAEFNRRMTTVSIKGEAVKNLASVFERKKSEVDESLDFQNHMPPSQRQSRKTVAQPSGAKRLISNLSEQQLTYSNEVQTVKTLGNFEAPQSSFEKQSMQGVSGRVSYEYVPLKENQFVVKDSKRNILSPVRASLQTPQIERKSVDDQEVINYDGLLPTIESQDSYEGEMVTEAEQEVKNLKSPVFSNKESTARSLDFNFKARDLQVYESTQAFNQEEAILIVNEELKTEQEQVVQVSQEVEIRQVALNSTCQPSRVKKVKDGISLQQNQDLHQSVILKNHQITSSLTTAQWLHTVGATQISWIQGDQDALRKNIFEHSDTKQIAEIKKNQLRQRRNFSSMHEPHTEQPQRFLLIDTDEQDFNQPAFTTSKRNQETIDKQIQEKLRKLDRGSIISEHKGQLLADEPLASQREDEKTVVPASSQDHQEVRVQESEQITVFKRIQHNLGENGVLDPKAKIFRQHWNDMLSTFIDDQEIKNLNLNQREIATSFQECAPEKSKELMRFQFLHQKYSKLSGMIGRLETAID